MSDNKMFGKANYNQRTFATRFKAKDLIGVPFRIIPPIKSCVESGKFFVYTAQHFGYFLPNPAKADSPLYAPFGCVQKKNRDGLILEDCAECKLIAQRRLEYDKIELDAKQRGLDAATKNSMLKPLTDWFQVHNLSKQYVYNIKTEKGEYGFNGWGYKAHKAIQRQIEAARKDGIDPLDPEQGVWFILDKLPGKTQNDVDWRCDFVYEEVIENGRRFKAIKPAPLASSEYDSILKGCADLEIDIVKVITPQQVQALVECSGDPREVAAIMGVASKVSQKEDEGENEPEEDFGPPPEVPVSHPVQTTTPPPVSIPDTNQLAQNAIKSIDDSMMALFQEFLKTQGNKTPAPQASTTVTVNPTPVTSTTSPTPSIVVGTVPTVNVEPTKVVEMPQKLSVSSSQTLSDDDFLKMIRSRQSKQ